jgi:hypothetical protein
MGGIRVFDDQFRSRLSMLSVNTVVLDTDCRHRQDSDRVAQLISHGVALPCGAQKLG